MQSSAQFRTVRFGHCSPQQSAHKHATQRSRPLKCPGHMHATFSRSPNQGVGTGSAWPLSKQLLRHAPVRAAQRSRRRASAAGPVASVVWRQLDKNGAWVAHSRSARTRGVCHFLGGAFAGAAPQLLYNLFIELLAESGYTVVATPYEVTFKHLDCARRVRTRFEGALEELRAEGRSYLAPTSAPVFGIGHSNGALLHLLMGSIDDAPHRANVIISFNNLQVGDAIPIPLGGIAPTLQAARSNPNALAALQLLSTEQVLQAAAEALPPFLLRDQKNLLSGAAPLLEQLGSVFGEVGDGAQDFTPTPAESRALVADSYRVRDTLLVRFADDTIDQTPEMRDILRERFSGTSSSGSGSSRRVLIASTSTASSSSGGNLDAPSSSTAVAVVEQPGPSRRFEGRVEELVLPGSHITPCGSDVQWDAGPVFSPVDVIAQVAKAASQADVRRLAQRVVAWMDGIVASTS